MLLKTLLYGISKYSTGWNVFFFLMIGTCTFEGSQCGWTDVSSGKYEFHLYNGVSPGRYGPATDHTLGTNTGQFYSWVPLSKHCF